LIDVFHVTMMKDSSDLVADEQFHRWQTRLRSGKPCSKQIWGDEQNDLGWALILDGAVRERKTKWKNDESISPNKYEGCMVIVRNEVQMHAFKCGEDLWLLLQIAGWNPCRMRICSKIKRSLLSHNPCISCFWSPECVFLCIWLSHHERSGQRVTRYRRRPWELSTTLSCEALLTRSPI
jgi:hypothetical protein